MMMEGGGSPVSLASVGMARALGTAMRRTVGCVVGRCSAVTLDRASRGAVRLVPVARLAVSLLG